MDVKVVTISDTLSRDDTSVAELKDLSGQKLVQLLSCSTILRVNLIDKSIIPDDFELIQQALISCSKNFDVILTTGGTGLSPRDVTPEATKDVVERECPGIVTALLVRSLQATPMASLSRLASGTIGSCLIVNLPGNSKAVAECFEVLEKILNHAVEIMKDKPIESTDLHKNRN